MRQNVDLTGYTTFGCVSRAEYFCEVTTRDALKAAIDEAKALGLTIHCLGGGANTIAMPWVKGLVIKMAIPGFDVRREADGVTVRLGAGEDMDSVIARLVDQGLGGLENLSAIPGTLGGAIVQNIGAYGGEIGPFVESVQIYDSESGEVRDLTPEALHFDYRHSVFKEPEAKGWIILGATLRLGDPDRWRPTLSYKAVEEEIRQLGLDALSLTPRVMRDLITNIRWRKLPDPKKVGNAGSFFTNPKITTVHWRELIALQPTLAWYELDESYRKIAAASLIDLAGLKGLEHEHVAVHKTHALILVNRGRATGEDVLALAQAIKDRVYTLFGVHLEREPVVLGEAPQA